MAIMINCATDWTFDLALADARKAKALPLSKGVRCPKNMEEGVKLFTYLKTIVKFEGQSDTPWDEEWQRNIDWDYVSDWYKDIYGQRPHFSKWYWRGLLGVYQSIVDFKSNADVMKEYADYTKRVRESF